MCSDSNSFGIFAPILDASPRGKMSARTGRIKTAELSLLRRRAMNPQSSELCLLRVPIGVYCRKVLPFLREIVQRENRSHRANGNAGSAVNALDRTDVKLGLTFVSGLILARMD